jgi:hypothetical protein
MNEKTKKLLLMNLPYLFVALFATKFGQAWQLASGADASQKLLHLMDGLTGGLRQRPERQKVPQERGIRFGPLGQGRGHQTVHRLRF